ncbi:hypothetical protein OSB04_009663 [Centaurea solstitialis]|uniref:F-box domain-containing protein n=1 Tax=Centaurea solstitialis TaxID=347529 RepID=A0AA38WMC4_9ASTR|nr:hypothetical protein OSB04_009663 [Centaurea solstitialis]
MKTSMAENEVNPSSIDNIPYEILNQIVSLIPLKEAVKTIILSSSWKHIWTPIQAILNIDNYDRITSHESGQRMNHFISTFLNTYESSYQMLNISLAKPKGGVGQETLFLKAIKGVEKELYITFHDQQNPKLPFSLPIQLSLCDKNDNFCYLKTLHLRSITSHAGSFLPELFSGCRNLETLSLERCNWLQDIELKAHDSLLQKFVVLDCEKMASVTISLAPNLKCFVYRGTLVKIVVKEVPKLCDVTLNFKGVCEVSDFESCEDDLVLLLASLKDIEVLTLSGWFLEWLCTRGVAFDDFEFKFNKLKELSWMDGCMTKQKRDSLACFLSLTPSLENLFIKIDEKWSTIQNPYFHQSWPQVWTVKSKDWQLEHLKMVKFFGFKIKEENENLVWLMDLLLKKAIVIKKMSVIEPESKVSWWVAKVPQTHLKKMASTTTTSSCYSSRSSLILSLNHKCCFQLTPVNDNKKLML